MAANLMKMTTWVLTLAMQISAVFYNFPGTAAAYTGDWYGDVNLNRIVDISDAKQVLGYLLGLVSLSNEQVCRADADRDGKITLKDIGRITGTAYNRYGLIAYKPSSPGGESGGDETPFDLGAYDLVVSPAGNDAWSGRLVEPAGYGTDGPLKTISRAKEILKTEKEQLSGAVTVWLRGGTYILDGALDFGEDDAQNATFRAYPGEKPEITASGAAGNWAATEVNGRTVWKTYIGAAQLNSLYRGDDTLPRSRYPKTGYFYVASVSDSDAINPASWNNQCHKAFYADKNDLKNFHNVNDVNVRILHLWKDELIPLAGCDPSSGRVSLSKYTTMTIRPGDRYYYENVFEALSDPGEWYYDRQEGMLYYVPRESDAIGSTVLRYGTLETVLTLNGCSGFRFEGITFRDTEWSLKSNSSVTMTGADGTVYTGLASPQAASDVSSAVRIVNSGNISFTHCTFTNIGMTAVKFCENTQNGAISHCDFYNIGASAVTIAGDNLPDDNPAVVHNIDVTDCRIVKYGRVFNYATGLLLMHANQCSLSHNEIRDGYYSGISAGWSWGYGYSVTHDLSICDNIIYDIGQGLLSDMGGIYTLGVQKGTVISGNIIHDVSCYNETEFGYGGWGLHIDEGSSYITVENNLVYRCSSQGLHINYGKDNIVNNNIFALSGDGQVVVDTKEDHSSMLFTHNIVVSRTEPIYNRVKTDEFKDDSNLYWDYCLKTCLISSGMQNYQFWESQVFPVVWFQGYYRNAVVKDPLFADIDKWDFTVCPNSPALTMGFVPWDYSRAGVRN